VWPLVLLTARNNKKGKPMTLYIIAGLACLVLLSIAGVALFAAGKLAGKLEVVNQARRTYHYSDVLSIVHATL
jgi:hypothetical protein